MTERLTVAVQKAFASSIVSARAYCALASSNASSFPSALLAFAAARLTEDERGTEMCERWADRLALARMHFARGDLKACQREIDEAARYAALAWQHFFPSP